MKKQAKPLAQKLDEQVFEKLLKYDANTQNLWDIVGIFEHERAKLRLEVAQYEEDITNCKTTLKTLREQIKAAQDILKSLEERLSSMPTLPADSEALGLKITELELENSKLRVEIRDLKSEFQLEENLAQARADSKHTESSKPSSKNAPKA